MRTYKQMLSIAAAKRKEWLAIPNQPKPIIDVTPSELGIITYESGDINRSTQICGLPVRVVDKVKEAGK